MSPTEQPMGELSHDDGTWRLQYERQLHHPPEKVWRALTESEHLQHWLPTDIVGPRVEGAAIDLPFWPSEVEEYSIESSVLHGTIRVWDPPRVFEWTWDTDLLRWELEPVDGGTRLRFTTWLGDSEASAADSATGYHFCLLELTELLDTGQVTPPAESALADWQQRYDAAAAAA